MDYQQSFHKGCLKHSTEGGFCFEIRHNLRSRKADWSATLPKFKQSCATLVGEDILIPDHSTVSTFLGPSTSNNAPPAIFFSAENLLSPCPPSLRIDLHPNNPTSMSGWTSTTKRKGGCMSSTFLRRSVRMRTFNFGVRVLFKKHYLPCVSSLLNMVRMENRTELNLELLSLTTSRTDYIPNWSTMPSSSNIVISIYLPPKQMAINASSSKTTARTPSVIPPFPMMNAW